MSEQAPHQENHFILYLTSSADWAHFTSENNESREGSFIHCIRDKAALLGDGDNERA